MQRILVGGVVMIRSTCKTCQVVDQTAKIKAGIVAPQGHTLIDADSAQIEARVLAWLAEQDDLVDQFEKGEDVYKHMASKIYNVPPDAVSKDQRFVGKTTILGAGYGMGQRDSALSSFGSTWS